MKGINQNTRPKNQPKDTYRYGKNGVSNVQLGLQENEPGFVKSAAVLPYKCIGVIPSDKYPILFCTDNVNSAIGYFNTDTDSYQPILDDTLESYKLGFHSNFYITGESQRNHLGEIVVAFTDKNKLVGYLNCDNPDVSSLKDISLFPIVQAPIVKISQDTGGILSPGAYFAAVRYTKKDGTITSFVGNTGVTIVAGATDSVTDKSLVLTMTNLDLTYDFVQAAILYKVNGVYGTPQLLPEASITSEEMTLNYTGTEVTTNTTLENVLIPQAFYTKVGTIGQLNDALYLGNLESAPTINMQRYANLIRVNWKSELLDTLAPSQEHVRGEKRSWMHEEVVAPYIRYSLTRGGWTQWFHIPGRAPLAGETDASTLANTQGITAKKFQVEDTIPSFNAAQLEGEMGYWENDNETYPDDPSFDSSTGGLGGVNLRNQKVRHHRMPSIAWCKENLYPIDTTYGKNKLDLLGLKLTNVIIPAEYADQIDGWQLGFGKRTLNNATVLAQGALMHSAQYAAYNGGAFTLTGGGTKYVSTGGNFHAAKKPDGNPPDNALGLDTKAMRFHGFDLLFNKPALSDTGYYLSTHLKLKRTQLQTEGFIEDNNLGNNDVRGPIVYLIDYLAKGLTPTVVSSAKRLRNITETQLVPNNTEVSAWHNIDLEAYYAGKLNASVMDTADITTHLHDVDENNQSAGLCIPHEVTHLSNMMRVRDDVYAPFTVQKVIPASDKVVGTTSTVFGGDTFIVDYSFHTYGWWMQFNQKFGDKSGTKVVRRIACEAASNLYARFETPGNVYSKWYPNSPIVKEDVNNYITDYSLKQDPNQFGYSKDFNALNELSVDTGIFNTNNEVNTIHPFRIHRGGQLGRQDKTRSWRTFLPLDYYEIKKNVGTIVNLEGQDDRLLIHCKSALLVTQDKTKLESDVLQVTLGSADIFQFDPQDAQSAPLGYAGTQHDLSCLRSPAGYFFLDANSQEIFMYKTKPENLGGGLYNTFLEIIKTFAPRTNTFIGDGITVGYDPEFKRLLLTCKYTKASKAVRFNLEDADIPTLVVGDYVYMDGRILEFRGVNNVVLSGVSCDEVKIPVIVGFTYDLEASVYNNYVLTTLSGTFVDSVTLLSTVPAALPFFTINPATRELIVNGNLFPEIGDVYQLNCRATSDTGGTTDFYITINIVA
jgi:hypothetical protein